MMVYRAKISILMGLAALVSVPLWGFQQADLSKCPDVLVRLVTGAVPAAPPKPTKPAPQKPGHEPEPGRRERRLVPIPAPEPNEPGRTIPEKPVHDPKDIQPEDLYSADPKVAPFWSQMPLGLRRVMVEGLRKERSELESHMRSKYGNTRPQTLMQAVVKLQNEIEDIESSHKPEILSVIRKMIEARYGELASGLRVGISTEMPDRAENAEIAHKGNQIPELPRNLDEGMVYRTEMRHLWQQGEGWPGMKEFAYDHAADLNKISPGLAEKYQELDRLYRFGQLAQLGLIKVAEEVDALPRETISAGREIVTTDFEMVESPDGSHSIGVKDVKGVAVGRNGWATAHEARKAASQMATPNEGAFRWMLSTERRQNLNDATNSNRAEIRQGVFGPQVVQTMRSRLYKILPASSALKGSALKEEDYLDAVDGIFSMHPGAFKNLMELLFRSDFDTNEAARDEARSVLQANGVIR